MGSEGKFETRTMKLALQMAMGQTLPDQKPPGPGKNGEEEASSINHRLIGWSTMLLWAYLRKNQAEIDRLTTICKRLLRHQLEKEFESLPNGATEQRSGTHKKQHYQYAALLAHIGRRFRDEELRLLAVAWLRCSLTLDELFLAPSPSPRGKLPAILQPGFRADPPNGARDFVGEDWWRVARLGQAIPINVIGRPTESVDQASLWFYSTLPPEDRAEIAAPLGPPPLRHPITIQRKGEEFIASMQFQPGFKEVQIYAGWAGGSEVYGFGTDPVPVLLAPVKSIITGSAIGSSPAPSVPIPDQPIPEPTDSAKQIAAEMRALAARLEKLP